MAGEPPPLELVGLRGNDLQEPLVLRDRPRLAESGQIIGRLDHQRLDALVDEVADLHRGDDDDVLGRFERIHAEHSLHEERVRAGCIGLEPGRRNGAILDQIVRQSRHAGQVAVVAGEVVRQPSPDHLHRGDHHVVVEASARRRLAGAPLLLGGESARPQQLAGERAGDRQPAVVGQWTLPRRRGQVLLTAELTQTRQQPPARQAQRGPAQVAPRERRDRLDPRRRERREQVPVLGVEAITRCRQFVAGHLAHPLGQQRVRAQPAGVQVLAEPDDVHDIGVEPDGGRQWRDQHALAESAHPRQ